MRFRSSLTYRAIYCVLLSMGLFVTSALADEVPTEIQNQWTIDEATTALKWDADSKTLFIRPLADSVLVRGPMNFEVLPYQIKFQPRSLYTRFLLILKDAADLEKSAAKVSDENKSPNPEIILTDPTGKGIFIVKASGLITARDAEALRFKSEVQRP